MPQKRSLEQRFPWAKIDRSPHTILPHRVPFPLARRFQQICATYVAEVYADQELTMLEYMAVACLDDFPGVDQRRLAALMGVDRTNVGQIVGQLEARGLVDRRINGADRRARELLLTARGKELRRRLRPNLLAAQDRMLAPLTPKEREVLIDLLTRVIEGNEAYARPGAGRRPPRKKESATVKGGTHDHEPRSAVSRGRDEPSRRSHADRAD